VSQSASTIETLRTTFEDAPLPNGWRWAKLLEIADRLPTGTQYERLSCKTEGKVPVVDQSESGYIGFHDNEHGVFASVEQPVVTFANHTCAVRLHEKPFSTIQNVFALRGKEGVDTHFLYWLLVNRVPQSFYGGHYPKLIATDLPLAPFPEQKRIAAILKEQMAAVERARAAAEAQLKAAKDLPASYLRDVFNSEEAQQWEKRKIRAWVERGHITDIQDGNHGELHPRASEYVPDGVPFVMANNIRNGTLDLTTCNYITPERAARLRIGFSKGGDVLLSHKGSLGFTAVVPESVETIILTPQVTYYRPNRELLDADFLCLAFRHRDFQKQLSSVAKQATRDYVGITAQRELFLSIPPIDTQQHIAQRIRERIEVAKGVEKSVHVQLATINKLPSSLLRQALTGKL